MSAEVSEISIILKDMIYESMCNLLQIFQRAYNSIKAALSSKSECISGYLDQKYNSPGKQVHDVFKCSNALEKC